MEGSDTLDMLQISANFEGTYPDLVHFINLLDKSNRLLIIESLNATPQQSGGRLNVMLKAGHIREGGWLGAMNWIPSNVGAEPKKIAMLAGIGRRSRVIVYHLQPQLRAEGPVSAPPPIISRAPVTTSYGTPAGTSAGNSGARTDRSSFRVTQGAASSATREFQPSLKIKNIEPSSIDPTLHLDLLAKLKTVTVEAGTRSLFEIGAAPPADQSARKSLPRSRSSRLFVGPQLPPARGGPARA